MANYNSPFVKKVWFYSQKVLPLVFDNSLSYYEALAHFAHKVNEIINTVNNQTMHMTEWEKEIALAMEVFEQELRQIQADFEERMEGKWSDFKAEMLAWKKNIDEDWTVMQSEFSALENLIQQQIENLAADYTQYKADLTAQQSAFETAQTARQSNFETAQTNRQTAFEQAQTTRQTNYENNLTNDWTTFQAEIESEMDLAKNKYYITYPGAYSALQTDPPTIPSIAGTFDFNSNIVRVFKTIDRKITLIKRCLYGDIDNDPDIPFIDDKGNPISYYVVFENPVVKEFFKPGISVIGTPSIQSGIQEFVVQAVPYITDDLFAVQPKLLAVYNTTSPQPADIPVTLNPAVTPYPSTDNYDYIVLTFHQMKTALTITQPTGATTKAFPGFIYDAFSGGVIRDPELVNLLDNIIPFALQRGEYTLNDQSALTFDTLNESKYYRYTASAIGNPVPGGYGIIVNIRYTAYAVQLLFSQTTASAPTKLLYRLGTDMNTTPNWRAWQNVGSGGGATVKTLTYTGTGSNTTTIDFPDTPTVILSIDGMGLDNGYVSLSSFRFGSRAVSGLYFNTESSLSGEIRLRAAVDGNSLTLSMGADAGSVCNANGETYTVTYI